VGEPVAVGDLGDLQAAVAEVDPAVVQRLLAAEWERFTSWSAESGIHNKRAAESLPLGVTSSFQHWDPYPISIVSARGAWLTDVDGNRLLDLSMGFGAMLVGHLNPSWSTARHRRADGDVGTLFVTPSPQATEMPSASAGALRLDMIRFTNSGTESLMYADPLRARLHRAQGDREDRGRLPRWLRRAAGLGQAGAGRDRPGGRPDPAGALRRRGRHRPRRAYNDLGQLTRDPEPSTARDRRARRRAGHREPVDRRPRRGLPRGVREAV
jgi:hypothetical protein